MKKLKLRTYGKKKVIALAVGTGLAMLSCGGMITEAAELELPASAVTIQGNEQWSEGMIRKMLPALGYEKVNVSDLSKQIQLINDANTAQLNADFQRQNDGTYHVIVTVKENQQQHVALNVNNTGNDYTGNWRTGITYTNNNLTGRADNFGIAYVTSPNHMDDVKQAAFMYKGLLPQHGDSFYVTGSYSDVDLGNIANFNGMGISATGRGNTIGAHYQHNLKYTQAHKQILDFGIDYKHYKNAQDYNYAGQHLLHDGTDFEVTEASVSYADIMRPRNQFFAWSLGYTGNINGNKEKFNEYRYGSDKQFNLLTASFNYQYRLPSDWILGLRMNGQYTDDNVVTTEQLGAGGMYSVRGFKERVASADKGYIGSFEIFTPEFIKHSRFSVFTDFARLVNNNSWNGELRDENLASWGVAYRYIDPDNGWFGTLSYAKVYDDLDSYSGNTHRPWQVSLTKQF